MEREPLSASAVNLWHTLMHINNKAGWIEEFTVPATVLKLKGGLTDSSFKRARKELEERGLVKCRSNGRNAAPTYKMKRLYKMNCAVFGEKTAIEEIDGKQKADYTKNQQTGYHFNRLTNVQPNQQWNPQIDRQTNLLNKQKEIKQNERKRNEKVEVSDAIVFYQENFGVVSPFLAEELLSWIYEYGDDFVMEAMKRALERGKFTFGYVKGILKSWVKQGIESVETLKAKEIAMNNARRSNSHYHNAQNQEVVPDWFLERKRKKRIHKENVSEEDIVQMEEILKKYKN